MIGRRFLFFSKIRSNKTITTRRIEIAISGLINRRLDFNISGKAIDT
jgi:hypothetical protein